MKNSTIVWILVVVLVVLGTIFLVKTPGKPGELDGLAQCLKDKGVTFYGAFWCPHCQAEKAAFGRSARLLPYVECSTPDTQGQTQICIDKKVTGYPTWVFPDGTRQEGEMTPQELADKAGCTLSGVATSSVAVTSTSTVTSVSVSSSTPTK